MSAVQFLITKKKTNTKEEQLETIEIFTNKYYTAIEKIMSRYKKIVHNINPLI